MEFVQTAAALNLDIKVLLVYKDIVTLLRKNQGKNLKGIYLILRCNGISMARWGTTVHWKSRDKKSAFFT